MGIRVPVAIAAVVLLVVAGAPAVLAPAGATGAPVADFEVPTYVTGSVDGQQGWGAQGIPINPNIDQGVVTNSGAPASFGAQSWRISNAYTTGSFGDWVFSPSAADEAGESSAESGGLSGGTRQTRFVAQWDFASALPSAEQPGLGMTVSLDRGDGARMSWVRMEDTPTGLQLLFSDYQRSIDPECDDPGDGAFTEAAIASGLDRGTAHTVKIVMDFVDGPANDIVAVYVDGSLVHTGTSWEDYFRDCELNLTRTVDSLLFRSGGDPSPASDGLGFLIDNVSVSSQTLSVPGAPTGLDASWSAGTVHLSWNAPAEDGGSPITGYSVYRDGTVIDTIDGATTSYADTEATASSVAHTYKVAALNAIGASADSNTDDVVVNLAWKGQVWEVRNGTATVNGAGGVDLTRLAGGESSLHLVGDAPVNAAGTPWVRFDYHDDGSSWQGIDLFLDSEENPGDDPRIQAGSLFSCGTLGYARHSIPAVETIVYPPDDSACVGPRPATEHHLYVGERSDGTVDYHVDGTWHSSTFLKDFSGSFPVKDITLRWRCSPTGAVTWERQCSGGETVTFDDFAMGSDHDEHAPAITLDTPPDGAVYRLGQVVHADFGCTDATGVAECDGTVPDGAVIDTSTTGDHQFTVTATDDIGNQSSITHGYRVIDPALTLSLVADEPSVVAGGAIHYHLTVSNTGDVALSGVTVIDPNAPACAGPVGSLAVGAHVTVDCAYTTTNGDVGVRGNAAAAMSAEYAIALSNVVTTSVTPAPGHITGTVTEAVSGNPLPGVWVIALRPSDFRLVGGGLTNASGGYDLGTPAGSYFLYVVDSTGNHVSGFHGAPATVTVPSGGTVHADPAIASTRGAIAGTITDAGTGDPIAGAWAIALGGEPFAPESVVVASGAGQFSLSSLPVGSHFVGWIDPTGAHAPRFSPDRPDVPSATALPVTAGTTTTANGALLAQEPPAGGSALTGTVTDGGTGDPLAGVHVVALSAADYGMARGAVTDGSGHYDLDVTAGDYKLVFIDSTGRHASEWYDGVSIADLADATTVTAPATTDVDLTPGTGAVAGTVTDAPSGQPLGGAWVLAIGSRGPAGGAVAGPDGSYVIGGLPPGGYRAAFIDATGVRLHEYWNDHHDIATSDTIDVAAGSTTSVSAGLAP